MKATIFLLFAVLFVALPIEAWNSGDGGLIAWDNNCWWSGVSAIGVYPSLDIQCGGVCIAHSGCRKFDWHDGTCYLYPQDGGSLSFGHQGWMCGYRT
jgi:hypothetical protein